jgi:hypothetical protein
LVLEGAVEETMELFQLTAEITALAGAVGLEVEHLSLLAPGLKASSSSHTFQQASLKQLA